MPAPVPRSGPRRGDARQVIAPSSDGTLPAIRRPSRRLNRNPTGQTSVLLGNQRDGVFDLDRQTGQLVAPTAPRFVVDGHGLGSHLALTFRSRGESPGADGSAPRRDCRREAEATTHLPRWVRPASCRSKRLTTSIRWPRVAASVSANASVQEPSDRREPQIRERVHWLSSVWSALGRWTLVQASDDIDTVRHSVT